MLLCVLISSAFWTAAAQEITIAVSANARFAVEEIISVYAQGNPAVKVQMVAGSSGKLTAQILNHAPFHIFLSADTSYPQQIYRTGLALEPPKVYAYGKLVWWSLAVNSADGILPLLRDKSLRRIAIANPRIAPYGKQAMAVIQALAPELESKLIYGRSVNQVNQYVLTNAVRLALTSQSVLYSTDGKNKGHWTYVDSTLYAPIAQSAVIIKTDNHQALQATLQFYDFLYSAQAAAIFRKFGYRLP